MNAVNDLKGGPDKHTTIANVRIVPRMVNMVINSLDTYYIFIDVLYVFKKKFPGVWAQITMNIWGKNNVNGEGLFGSILVWQFLPDELLILKVTIVTGKAQNV